jgi:hypothetical protein
MKTFRLQGQPAQYREFNVDRWAGQRGLKTA